MSWSHYECDQPSIDQCLISHSCMYDCATMSVISPALISVSSRIHAWTIVLLWVWSAQHWSVSHLAFMHARLCYYECDQPSIDQCLISHSCMHDCATMSVISPALISVSSRIHACTIVLLWVWSAQHWSVSHLAFMHARLCYYECDQPSIDQCLISHSRVDDCATMSVISPALISVSSRIHACTIVLLQVCSANRVTVMCVTSAVAGSLPRAHVRSRG